MKEEERRKKIKLERIEFIFIGIAFLIMSMVSYFHEVEVNKADFMEIVDKLDKKPLFTRESKSSYIEFKLKSKINKHCSFRMDNVYRFLGKRRLAIKEMSVKDSVSLWVNKSDYMDRLHIPDYDMYGPEVLQNTTLEVYGLSKNNRVVYSLDDYKKSLVEDKQDNIPFCFLLGLIFLIPNLIYKDKKKGVEVTIKVFLVVGLLWLLISTSLHCIERLNE